MQDGFSALRVHVTKFEPFARKCDMRTCHVTSLLDKQVVRHAPFVATIVAKQLTAGQVENAPAIEPASVKQRKAQTPALVTLQNTSFKQLLASKMR